MMTREEAIEELERLLMHWDLIDEGIYDLSEHDKDSVEIALSALRPVSRERVEKLRGEWMFPIFADQQDENDPRLQCSECGSIETPLARHRFCPSCGAPMTDEAVEMVMKKLEALYDNRT